MPAEWGGRTALVTGASGGIGEAFARRLSAQGCHLVLVARRKDALQALSRELSRAHRIQAQVIARDLGTEGAAAAVFAETERRGRTVDLLVNNAGFGLGGAFLEAPLSRHLEMIRLNVVALTALTHLYLPGMVERGSGAVVNVASTAAFQAVPYMGAYAATKAYVLSLSEALWEEYRGRGVRVLALCPGPTSTSFFDVAGMAASRMPSGTQSPDDVVKAALEALRAKRSHVVSGSVNYALANASRLLPRELVTRVTGRLLQATGHAPAPGGAAPPAVPNTRRVPSRRGRPKVT